ncbi:MAG: ribosome-associated protein [Candidatus Azotimanducaceae bacterium]|jgi:ribosome-associated protein
MSNSSSNDPKASESISKTELKRQAEALQKVGRRIAELSSDQRASLDLPSSLEKAINDYNRFASREARRRQLQFVGKIMRDIPNEAIQARLDDIDGVSAKAKSGFHQLELWRDRLINDPEALAVYIDQNPQLDRQALRHAIQKARGAKTPAQEKATHKALFRFLRDVQAQQDLDD